MRINQLQFDHIVRQIEREFGKIIKGEEAESLVLFRVKGILTDDLESIWGQTDILTL